MPVLEPLPLQTTPQRLQELLTSPSFGTEAGVAPQGPKLSGLPGTAGPDRPGMERNAGACAVCCVDFEENLGRMLLALDCMKRTGNVC